MLNIFIQGLWIIATIMIFICGIYFSFKLNFVHLNIKQMLKEITKKNNKKDSISAFQSLAMSLAGRIGVGSLAGVALAVYLGGPGVLFWMWFTSLFCATDTFAETVLAFVFRKHDTGNIFRGGPFYYIKEGLGKKRLAILYALLIIVSYNCGFMTIQANTMTRCITDMYNINPIIIGVVIAILTAITIFGGVKKIASTTAKLVPFMSALYISICLYIIAINYELVPKIIAEVISTAFNFRAFGFGALSTLLIGMQKGIFSSEVGLGTGSIVAVTADSESSAGNGLVQTFGIHFENILIAIITTLVICMSDYQSLILSDPNGIEITLNAFKYHMGNLGPIIVTIVITLFGLSTVLTGYYYGESSLKFIKKTNKLDIALLKIVTILVLVFGSIISSESLWNITDIMVGIIAVINVYAIFKLRNIVMEEYKYWRRHWFKKIY